MRFDFFQLYWGGGSIPWKIFSAKIMLTPVIVALNGDHEFPRVIAVAFYIDPHTAGKRRVT